MPIQLEHHDSALGRWQFARWCPPQLAGVVDSLWYFEGALANTRERIFPDGRIELIVHLGPVYRQVDGTRVEPFTTCCISGLLLRSNLIEAPPEPCAVLGMRLHPAGAFALLRQPLHELAGITVDLNDLVGAASRELAECCATAVTPQQRMYVAARWIASRMAHQSADPAVAWTARQIELHAGAISIAQLRQHVGWSKTRFTATFKHQIGVTPKILARIIRFRRVLEQVHRADASLAQIALNAGYFDQAHFNAEFRELSGFTPSAFLAARRYPGTVSIAE
ncbi:MAG: helix-turn-helix domain-containing protein [Longimicrobiales bacterium]